MNVILISDKNTQERLSFLKQEAYILLLNFSFDINDINWCAESIRKVYIEWSRGTHGTATTYIVNHWLQ